MTRRTKFDDAEHSDAVHSSVFPADVRPQDRIVARIRPKGSDQEFVEVPVWKLSPLGFEFAVDAREVSYSKGAQVDVDLVLGGSRSEFNGIVVDKVTRVGREIVGVRFTQESAEATVEGERRKSRRWLCSEEYFPTCVAPAPGRFDEYMFFRVLDISSTGARLATSLRNKFLLKDSLLKTTVVFPIGSVAVVSMRVVRVEIGVVGAEDKLLIGVEFLNLPKHALLAIGQYLVQFSSLENPLELDESGIPIDSLSKGVTFSYVRSNQDYLEVLRLRHEANLIEGHLADGSDVFSMADEYDNQSRIMMASYRGKIVGTGRFRFLSDGDIFEFERSEGRYAGLPRRETAVEVSRVAIDRSYRGNDLLAGLFRYGMVSMTSTDRPWIVMSTAEKFVSFYEKLGLKRVGEPYKNPMWKHELHVMVANHHEILKGRDVHPAYWAFVWRDVSAHLIDSGMMDLSKLDVIRLKFLNFISPFILGFIKNRRLRVGKRAND